MLLAKKIIRHAQEGKKRPPDCRGQGVDAYLQRESPAAVLVQDYMGRGLFNGKRPDIACGKENRPRA